MIRLRTQWIVGNHSQPTTVDVDGACIVQLSFRVNIFLPSGRKFVRSLNGSGGSSGVSL